MKKKLLIIDDEVTITTMFERVFSKEYSVKVAHGGEQAIAIARTWSPDLITLDVNMPEMNGYDVAQKLLSYEGTSDIPIIMITALTSIDSERRGLSVGALDYITKPCTLDTLRLRIESHLKHHEKIVQTNSYRVDSLISYPLIRSRRRSGIFTRTYKITKRLFDIVLSLIGLILLIPILLLIAIVIRLDTSGPALFTQNRTGLNGKRFKMYKFRTMLENAEELKEKYVHLNDLTWPDFKITNDPRITSVGKFLRRSSLDELPQLWNILMGDMSFVGPRPTSFKADKYELWQTERMEVRPGLTGLWQVSARAEVDLDGRAELDIEYIENQSWLLDIQILWQTVGVVLSGRGAR